jgi:transcriptional regulator of nitric oxide reductase
VLKTFVAVASVLACCTAAVLAADRIFTNPNPEAQLKRLFPKAAAFSKLEGTPLHFSAYSTDPQKNPPAPPLGYAFWTTDMVPNEHGYHGPIYMLVGMDLTGIITGVVVDYDSEPYGYFSVDPPEFAAQFKGKSIRDKFMVGADVDAVSRATLSVNSAARAIRDSSRMVARALLNPEAVKR